MSIYKIEKPTLDYLYKAKENITKEIKKMDKKKLLAQLEFINSLEINLEYLENVIERLENKK